MFNKKFNKKIFLFIIIIMTIGIALGLALANKKSDNFYDLHYKNDLWKKYVNNPILIEGDNWSRKDVFDVSVIRVNDIYQMWYSGRDFNHSEIGYANSSDGLYWKRYIFNPVLTKGKKDQWDYLSVNRPSVIYDDNDKLYKMWYTGYRKKGKVSESNIGYAESLDGIKWKRHENPVINITEIWEGTNIQCPNVIYDDDDKLYKMWFSGGEFFEPDQIGYAYSRDGKNWTKYSKNPIFYPSKNWWESKKIGSFQVVKINETFYSFYNAFDKDMISRIGMAKSKNGIDWIRNPNNPIINQSIKNSWDDRQIYKPWVIYENNKWFMYYNARGSRERIGLAIKEN